jgi:hypothetical protein
MDQKQHSRITRLWLWPIPCTRCASFSEPAYAAKDEPPYARDWGITTDARRLPPCRSPTSGWTIAAFPEASPDPPILFHHRISAMHRCTTSHPAPSLVLYVYTFAPHLHQNSGKVQMKKMPGLVVIVVSKREIYRDVY